MEEVYCYICNQVQCAERENPRYDWNTDGEVLEIIDITYCNCQHRVRLYKRVVDHPMDWNVNLI